jgi:hypothetical protein
MSLGEDVWAEVFGFLSFGGLQKVRRVCKDWKRLVDTNSLVWLKMIQQHSTPQTTAELKSTISNMKSNKAVQFLQQRACLYLVDFSFKWQNVRIEGRTYHNLSISIFQNEESPWSGRFHVMKTYNWENAKRDSGGESITLYKGIFSLAPANATSLQCIDGRNLFPKSILLKCTAVEHIDYEHNGSEEEDEDTCDFEFEVDFIIEDGKLAVKLDFELYTGFDQVIRAEDRMDIEGNRTEIPFFWDEQDWTERRKVPHVGN